jgi:uncharacterized membrane protein YcfT
VAFAKPFRMPDFFLIAGLFLSRVIDRDWRTYLDKKVVHFGYFYLLWVTIQFAFKAPGIAAETGAAGVVNAYALAFVEPFGTLWFIYLLPVFFVVVKAVRRVPWWAVWVVGAALETANIATGWTLIDEFASRFVYFYTGYVFAPAIFRLAAWTIANAKPAVIGLLAWALLEAAVVIGGWSEWPGVSLALGLAGASAVVAFAALLSRSEWMAPLRYAGRHSLVIYLAFFLPMAVSRAAVLRLGAVDVGTASALVTVAGVVSPLVLFWIVRGTRARVLFERPAWAHLRQGRRELVAAE